MKFFKLICKHFGYKGGTHLLLHSKVEDLLITKIFCNKEGKNISQCLFERLFYKKLTFIPQIKCFKNKYTKSTKKKNKKIKIDIKIFI